MSYNGIEGRMYTGRVNFYTPSYSALEARTRSYGASINEINPSIYKPTSTPVFTQPKPEVIYVKDKNYVQNEKDSYYSTRKPQDFSPVSFLAPNRPRAKLIKASEEVKELIEQTFELLMKKPLPNMQIFVCDEKEMTKNYPGQWHEGILGFAMPSEQAIFVKEAPLDQLMLTIGHEIGHLLTGSLDNKRDEEAKAYAFSLAWAKIIKENNIGGLKDNITLPAPAQNGLHDKAFEFVGQSLKSGEDALTLFYELSRGYLHSFRF